MPLKQIAVSNKQPLKLGKKVVELKRYNKNFDSLKSELFLISDRHKMFNLTWHGFIAVMVFSCSIMVLLLLKA